jgi:hypothetical protein
MLQAVNPRAIVRLEGLGKLKTPMISSEFEPVTFLLVAKRLKHLRYRMLPPPNYNEFNTLYLGSNCLRVQVHMDIRELK